MQTGKLFTPVLILSFVAVLVLSGCIQQAQQTGDDDSSMMDDGAIDDSMGDDAMGDDSMMGDEGKTITYTDNGFSPAELNVKSGDTVTWKNMSNSEMWPASAMHPTHTAYPGSGIEKCGTDEEESIFDACRGIGIGEQFSFTFNIPGEWFYHDK